MEVDDSVFDVSINGKCGTGRASKLAVFVVDARSNEAPLMRDNDVDSNGRCDTNKRHASVPHANRTGNWKADDARTTRNRDGKSSNVEREFTCTTYPPPAGKVANLIGRDDVPPLFSYRDLVRYVANKMWVSACTRVPR